MTQSFEPDAEIAEDKNLPLTANELMRLRAALLSLVDVIERLLFIEPRTAELRQRQKMV